MFDELLKRNGIKTTKQRLAILELLHKAEGPMTARAILSALESADIEIWFSTVYRVLELFTEKKIVEKASGFDDNEALFKLNNNEHIHNAVCTSCHKVISLDCCPMEGVEADLLKKHGFNPTGHRLEMYGICKECSQI